MNVIEIHPCICPHANSPVFCCHGPFIYVVQFPCPSCIYIGLLSSNLSTLQSPESGNHTKNCSRRKSTACVGHYTATMPSYARARTHTHGEWEIAFAHLDIKQTFPSTVLGTEDRRVNKTSDLLMRSSQGVQADREINR